MANFWDSIINKITGRNTQQANTPPVDISHVAESAAIASDPRLEVAQREAADAAKAEADKQMVAAQDDASKQQVNDSYLSKVAIYQTAALAVDEVAAAADQFEIIKEHTLTYDDTLSGLALHFYGHATPEYWGLIILANKTTIGDKVKDYTPGKVIKIPVLPDSMKK